MKFCCPFHADGGDEALPCAPDIPASHHDFAEMELRVLGAQLNRALTERFVIRESRRCNSMRENFALLYSGTRSGPFLIRAHNPQARFTPKPPKEKP